MTTELFPFIENAFTKGELITSKTDFKEIYMAIKFLSLHPGSFFAAEEANRLSTKLPNWATACYLFYSTPKARAPKITYPKSAKDKQWPKELLEVIMKNFYCPEHHAIQIASILNKKDPSIIASMGVEVKKTDGDRKVSKKRST